MEVMESDLVKPSEASPLCWVLALWSLTLASRGDIEALLRERKRLTLIRDALRRFSPASALVSWVLCAVLFWVVSFNSPTALDVLIAALSGFLFCVAVISVFVYFTTRSR